MTHLCHIISASILSEVIEVKMVAFCGIDCANCPAYIATYENNDRLRTETAAKWSEMFHSSIKKEDINCLGCHSGGPLFSYCKECGIRKCALEQKIKETCAECADYSCQLLTEFHKMLQEEKKILDRLHSEIEMRS